MFPVFEAQLGTEGSVKSTFATKRNGAIAKLMSRIQEIAQSSAGRQQLLTFGYPGSRFGRYHKSEQCRTTGSVLSAR